MHGYLKEATATTLRLGPFVDKGDGVTYEVGMAAAMNHASTGVLISKEGGALAARTTLTLPVYDSFGYYLVNLDATDTATVGRLKVIFGDAAVCLPCEASFTILPTKVYNSVVAGSDNLEVDAVQWLGAAVTLSTGNKPDVNVNEVSDDATAADNLETACDGGSYNVGGGSIVAASVTAGVTLANGAVTDASLAGNMEIVFETDFATNYNATRNAWATNAQDFVGTTASDPFNGQVVAASVTGAVASVGSGVTLANGAITDASLAGNMEIVFETDFATNYNTTRNAWATNAQDFVGTTASDPFNGQIVAASVTGAVGSVTTKTGYALVSTGLDLVTAWTTDITGSLSGAVGSVAGNVDGNVSGSVASLVGHTVQTGDTYALASGLTGFAAIDTVVDAILEDTGTTLDGRIPAALVSGRMSSDAVAIGGSTAVVTKFVAGCGQVLVCVVDTVVNTHTPTTTEFQTDTLTEATADHFIGSIVKFTSGDLAGQTTDITDSVNVGGITQLTVTAMTDAPANNDTFVIY